MSACLQKHNHGRLLSTRYFPRTGTMGNNVSRWRVLSRHVINLNQLIRIGENLVVSHGSIPQSTP